ncbi:hydroxymethylbilane synthase [Pontibacter beigongshangensis]|uniref:hydroxymethylbilane synthase n=1 Tax=Pontibacter beigongshangensis TaxID=2574733 RepID=UPI00164F2185|nr:hydroxymethylbilane synthase [Pontibacter beigongshangensis]
MQTNHSPKIIRLGTRGSKLAMWQAHAAADRITAAGFAAEIVAITTKGDQMLDKSLDKLGSKGVFTEELEDGLRDGSIDIAVHSAKDVQSSIPDDLELLAFMEREKVNDVLLSFDPAFKLTPESNVVIGSSSTRRRALLKKYYPHVSTVDARGNLQTRLQKLESKQFDVLLLAYAGVHRMGYDDMIVHTFPENQFVPAAGQGSVAIECARNLDPEVKQRLKAALDHADTHVCLLAERAFLRTMEGGCSIPSFALATLTPGGLQIEGGLVSLDGQTLLQETMTADPAQAEELGVRLATSILGQGGKEILKSIRAERGE